MWNDPLPGSTATGEHRVLVAGNDPTLRREIVGAVDGCAGFRVVAEAGSTSEALSAAARERPHLAIAELGMSGAQKLVFLRTLRRLHPDVALLVFSQHPERELGLRCLKAGAHGFLDKGASADEIRFAIRTAAAGRRYLSPALFEALLAKAPLPAPHHTLSGREREVLDGLARGMRTADIAAALGIKPKTVHTYRTRVFEKLGVRNDIGLASYAIEHELVPNPRAVLAGAPMHTPESARRVPSQRGPRLLGLGRRRG